MTVVSNQYSLGSNRCRIAAALVVSLVVILLRVLPQGPKVPAADEFIYLDLAYSLNTAGVFTDGSFAETPASSELRPGRFFAPAYPVFLSLMSRLDPSLREFIACQTQSNRKPDRDCPPPSSALLIVQSLFAAIGVTCIFVIAHVLSGSGLTASIALALALATGEPSYYARTYLSENTAFLGFYLALASGVLAFVRRDSTFFAIAGASLALAALSRPSYLWLFYAIILWLCVMAVLGRERFRIGWPQVAAFALAGTVVTAPWMVRNLLLFGDLSLSSGYGGFILAQRVAYNAMTWTEWGIAFIFWLPDFGDSLAKVMFAPESYKRLGYNDPSSFYLIGNRELGPRTLVAAGGRDAHVSYLLKHHVFADFSKHVLVTIPLTLRGIWVGKYLALAGVVLLIPVGFMLARSKRLLPFAFLVFALFFMAGLHGFVSVNVIRYNVPMIALYAFVVAYVLVDICRRFGWLPEERVSTHSTTAR